MALFKKKSMDDAPVPPKQKKPTSLKSKIAALIVIIIIAIGLYYVFFLYVNQTVIQAPATANVTASGTIFSVNGQQYLISLSEASISTGQAYIHISKLPIFLNTLLNVTLPLNNITKINAGSVYANMGIQLLSMSTNSITIQISPLDTSLAISPDSQHIKQIQGTLYTSGQAATTITTTTIATTTTIGTGSSTTTTAATTTTTIAVNNTQLEISAALGGNNMYALLLNFSKLYTNTTGCTQSGYDTLYPIVTHMQPNPPNDYPNASQITPYSMSSTTAQVGSGLYNVTFTTKAHAQLFDNVPAVILEVNTNSNTVTYSISSKGIFEGQSYSTMDQNYVQANSEGACGVEV
jgi:hypothetical protein